MRTIAKISALVLLLVACADDQKSADGAGAGAPEPEGSIVTRADADAGKVVAEAWCASCHSTSTEVTAADVGPPWSAIASDPKYTDDYLQGFLTAPHGQMQSLSLTRQQISDLVAYIRSLGGS
jgi:mono/diheme cytochrome c family protein